MTTAKKILVETRRSENRRRALARERCRYHLAGQEVEAARRDNGWSTTDLYDMPDGSSLRYDGRGWHAE